jgi:hypothetical protein
MPSETPNPPGWAELNALAQSFSRLAMKESAMKPSRREVIAGALVAALAAATPKSLFALSDRSIPGSQRFLIVTLRDGRRLAIDRLNDKTAFLLTKRPASDGEYPLSRAGALEVRNGTLRSLKGRGQCTGYVLSQEGEAVVVKSAEGQPVLRVPVRPSR